MGVWTEPCLSDIERDMARMGVAAQSFYKFVYQELKPTAAQGAELESREMWESWGWQLWAPCKGVGNDEVSPV